MVIRTATMKDLDEITKMEAACFPEAEAAKREAFEKRLSTFPTHFWVMELEGQIVSGINGITTNEQILSDEMYADETLHDENGAWQMIFGVTTLPAYQKRGYAGKVMEQVISDCRSQKRKGIILTCKERMIPFYQQFGFVLEGKSQSNHGGASWHKMRLVF